MLTLTLAAALAATEPDAQRCEYWENYTYTTVMQYQNGTQATPLPPLDEEHLHIHNLASSWPPANTQHGRVKTAAMLAYEIHKECMNGAF